MNRLSARLASEAATESFRPLEYMTVVVHNSGMARWISMELARLNGVCASMRYLYPNTLLDLIAGLVIPGFKAAQQITVECMTWRVMQVLPELLDHPGFESIKAYCGNAQDDRALYQLAARIADSFDQYSIFRPEMVLEWDAGQDKSWQPVLWRAVTGGNGMHRARQLQLMRESLRHGSPQITGLPRQISVFGISYLPPYHLELLNLLSSQIPISVYMLNPCGEYWGDIVSARKQAFIKPSDAGKPAPDYYETGNPLLSSLGVMGQEYFNLLMECDADMLNLDEAETSARGDCQLHLIQEDILHLRNRSENQGHKTTIPSRDCSVQVHSCHSAMREMEVLHDSLLKMFEEMPELEPRHIVVMIPDIEAYAPYISTVFSSPAEDRPRIPFTITDRSKRSDNPEIETFIKILQLPTGRFGINQMLELFGSVAIMRRFELEQHEVDSITAWLHQTNVRWGLDAAQREQLGFPPYPENSWQTALERLLLGYALPQQGNLMFGNILPWDGIEGRRALPLGKLCDFMAHTRAVLEMLSVRQPITAWADTLTAVVSLLMSQTGTEDNRLKAVFGAIDQLRETALSSGGDVIVGLDVVNDWLSAMLSESGASYGFMGGRVTFCAMLPMRSIPFRVICLAGMNDSSFPRASHLPGFSLMNGKRRRGDKSVRDEDRYLFLEALMSAGERLLISYTGQNIRDNSTIPPSVVVSELIDYIEAGFAYEDGSRPQPVTRHYLHPFSMAYFPASHNDRQLFSYSRSNHAALLARQASGGRREALFCSEALPPLQENNPSRELNIRQLIAFFRNPAASFLSRRLGVNPSGIESHPEERESFNISPLAAYGIKGELVHLLLSGEDPENSYTVAKASGILPPMAAGQLAFDSALMEARLFTERLLPHFDAHSGTTEGSVLVGNTLISGKISGLTADKMLRFRCASLRGKDMLSIWIEHLLLNIFRTDDHPRTSLLICRDTSLRLPPLDNAKELLEGLITIFNAGMLRPLPFFPESSRGFVEKGEIEARRRWKGGGKGAASFAESQDPAFRLCFARTDPLDNEFRQLSEAVYRPIMELSETQTA